MIPFAIGRVLMAPQRQMLHTRMARPEFLQSLTLEQLHVGGSRIARVPRSFQVGTQLRRIKLNARFPKIRIVIVNPEQIVHVENRRRSSRTDQCGWLFESHPEAKFKKNVGIMLGKICDDEISSEQLVHDRRVNQVATFSSSRFHSETGIYSRRCDEVCKNLFKKARRVLLRFFSERDDNEGERRLFCALRLTDYDRMRGTICCCSSLGWASAC